MPEPGKTCEVPHMVAGFAPYMFPHPEHRLKRWMRPAPAAVARRCVGNGAEFGLNSRDFRRLFPPDAGPARLFFRIKAPNRTVSAA